MPVITSLDTQKNNPDRVSVSLDGAFAFGASMLLVLGRGLAIGDSLSEADIARLEHDDSAEKAYEVALGQLSYRPRSRREVADYLRRRKVDAEIARVVLDRLQNARLLDDVEFARYWIENRQAFQPRGSKALRMELRQKGISREVIEEALVDMTDEDNTAYQAGLRKMRSFGALDEREFFRKMVGFLQRRGFPYEAAAAATRRLAEEAGREEAEK
ncbi:MAG: regulatory protein RecX [Chloroflexota bacterium]